ncbi:HpcH/HpaI aldolase family protein [Hydrogenophaga laconesensis]|uniref:2-keto-3-deoxy-L-rhamnonate aldolase RhmA n=1 Tax=Hydrogenophaga laconesensis TaxID=1805971 RepID=A0ABU1VHQ8_9BURK|nr:aldolase/citrate lyase family protein [Hydrogenophaga laconesensis]MDR7097017.1 2-keto-3-deoxy-L-rhamnonate aldolase RhmA [Hydrogenophaga laconesensis]
MATEALPNAVVRRFAAGEAALGLGIQQLRAPAVVGLAQRCGFHFLFIDLEHGPLTCAMAVDIAAAALPAGLPALVRVPGKNSPDIARLLDGGVQGIVVPHVDTPEEAQAVASACKYPPLGRRSFFGLQPHFGYRRVPVHEAMALGNAQVLTVVMLESPQALRHVDEIAAVPGIDVLMIGCNDLSMELGIPGELDHPLMVIARHAVVDACRRHGKTPGLGGIADAVLLRRCLREEGMRFVLACNDTDLLLDAGVARVDSLQQA